MAARILIETFPERGDLERERERERERENSKWKKISYNDCSLGSLSQNKSNN